MAIPTMTIADDYMSIYQDMQMTIGLPGPSEQPLPYTKGMTVDALAGFDIFYIDRSYVKMGSDFNMTNDAAGVISFTTSSGGLVKLVNFEKIEFPGSPASINLGTSGPDTVTGGPGNDRFLYGLDNNDTIGGGDGNDLLNGGPGGDILDGGVGNDTASYAFALKTGTNLGVTVSLDGTLVKTGEAVGDTLIAIENLTGSAFNDKLKGNTVANQLYGMKGADVLTGGGAADKFIYKFVAESAGTNIDKIMDFSKAQGDKIDVSLVDANSTLAGNQSFTSLISATATFSKPGQYRLKHFNAGTVAGIPGAGWKVDFNINTTSTAEMTIYIQTKDSFVNNTTTPWFVP